MFHDWLLEITPEGIEHSCDMCSGEKPTEARQVATDTLNEDDVKAQVDKAVADALATAEATAQAKIADLEAKLAERDMDETTKQAVADAVAPLETKVAELTKSLEDELMARQAAEADHQKMVDWLEAESEVLAVADRRASRVEQIKATGRFPEDTFDESKEGNKALIDKWASHSDEVFADLLEGWKLGSEPAKTETGNGPLPEKRSAVTDTVTEGADGKKSPVSRLLASTIASPSQTSS